MKAAYLIIILLAAAVVALSVRVACHSKSSTSGADAICCIMSRASVRAYSDKAIPDSVMTTILKAGMAAPSAANKQPWELIVITDRTTLDAMAQDSPYCKMVAKAPAAIVVCGNIDKCLDGDDHRIGNWVLDCSAVSENILLAAHALGLGAVWCGIYPEEDRAEALRKTLNIPANLEPLNIIVMGYPDKDVNPKDKWDESKVHYNRF